MQLDTFPIKLNLGSFELKFLLVLKLHQKKLKYNKAMQIKL